MSSRRSMLQATAVAAVLALTAPSAQAAFWTTPTPVVAGQPARVVFTTSSRGGQPQVEVRVDGDQIVLVQSNPCGPDLCFATWVPATAEATLPPLEPGTYTVMAAWEDDELPAAERATLQVEATSTVQVLPADGFWSPVGQPGSGLFLERRGDLLAVSTYSYATSGGEPLWLLGSGTYAGDSAPLLMRAFHDGDCLGCTDHRAPSGPQGMAALQLRFESARRAWLDFVGPPGNPTGIPVTSLPYGATYIPHTLTDSVDAEFGPLPLPDLRGSWLFAIEGDDAPPAHVQVRLDSWTLDGDTVRFDGNVDVECQSATDAQRAGCTFRPGMVFTPPPPAPLATFYGSGWFVPLGDIQEDRMRGVFEDGDRVWRVQGFRTAAPPRDE